MFGRCMPLPDTFPVTLDSWEWASPHTYVCEKSFYISKQCVFLIFIFLTLYLDVYSEFFGFCKYALCTSNVLSCIYMLYTVLADSVNGCII